MLLNSRIDNCSTSLFNTLRVHPFPVKELTELQFALCVVHARLPQAGHNAASTSPAAVCCEMDAPSACALPTWVRW
jgi:hypothetical protein